MIDIAIQTKQIDSSDKIHVKRELGWDYMEPYNAYFLAWNVQLSKSASPTGKNLYHIFIIHTCQPPTTEYFGCGNQFNKNITNQTTFNLKGIPFQHSVFKMSILRTSYCFCYRSHEKACITITNPPFAGQSLYLDM
jgi:hypothetical protein